MSLHRLKLISEAYRNVAQAPTQTYTKGTLLDNLERMLEEEIKDIKDMKTKIAHDIETRPPDKEEMPF